MKEIAVIKSPFALIFICLLRKIFCLKLSFGRKTPISTDFQLILSISVLSIAFSANILSALITKLLPRDIVCYYIWNPNIINLTNDPERLFQLSFSLRKSIIINPRYESCRLVITKTFLKRKCIIDLFVGRKKRKWMSKSMNDGLTLMLQEEMKMMQTIRGSKKLLQNYYFFHVAGKYNPLIKNWYGSCLLIKAFNGPSKKRF